jgi:hypothetical protein
MRNIRASVSTIQNGHRRIDQLEDLRQDHWRRLNVLLVVWTKKNSPPSEFFPAHDELFTNKEKQQDEEQKQDQLDADEQESKSPSSRKESSPTPRKSSPSFLIASKLHNASKRLAHAFSWKNVNDKKNHQQKVVHKIIAKVLRSFRQNNADHQRGQN